MLISICAFFCACTKLKPDTLNISESELFEAKESPSIRGKRVFSTAQYERDLAISPSGKELFFTLLAPRNALSVIMYSKNIGGKWSDPEVAWFSGMYSDLEPAFHPDGTKLYFASNRPTDIDSNKTDFDIWKIERSGEKWLQAENLGSPINNLSSTNNLISA